MGNLQNTRKITVVSTSGFGYKVFESSARTWGELKSTLAQEIMDIDRLEAVESVNKTSLALDDARLPEGNFNLFLRPVATKAGSDYHNLMDKSFRELREILTDLDFRGEATEYAQDECNKDHWTQLNRAELADFLDEVLNVGEEEEESNLISEVDEEYHDEEYHDEDKYEAPDRSSESFEKDREHKVWEDLKFAIMAVAKFYTGGRSSQSGDIKDVDESLIRSFRGIFRK